eukprot:EG_transcript_6652
MGVSGRWRAALAVLALGLTSHAALPAAPAVALAGTRRAAPPRATPTTTEGVPGWPQHRASWGSRAPAIASMLRAQQPVRLWAHSVGLRHCLTWAGAAVLPLVAVLLGAVRWKAQHGQQTRRSWPRPSHSPAPTPSLWLAVAIAGGRSRRRDTGGGGASRKSAAVMACPAVTELAVEEEEGMTDGTTRPKAKNVAIHVTKDAERQVAGGHPWVYAESVTSESHRGEVGDLAVVFGGKNRLLAVGLYDPASPIRVRVLHVGSSTPIDGAFWRQRIASARQVRAGLEASGTTTGYRCLAGENDGFPGLVLDRYDNVFVLKLYSGAWLRHLDVVTQAVAEVYSPASLVFRVARAVAKEAADAGLKDGQILRGSPVAGPVLFQEEGLWFQADVLEGQKTGHFLDQRDNRRRVGALAKGRRVLDVCCCTGGFAVHAAAGGAAEVHLVDRSAAALETAAANLALNRNDPVLGSLAAANDQYDVVVLDPPAFAVTAGQVPRALAAQGRLTVAGCRVVRPGGVLVQSSCTARIPMEDFVRTLHTAARGAGYRLVELERTEHAVDHPVRFPQGAYLKTLYARAFPLGR